MKNKLFTFLTLATLLTIPLVKADMYMPYLAEVYQASLTILLIPIILVEGILAYFLLRKNFNLEVKLWYPLVIFFVANIVSTLFGIPLSVLLPFGSKMATLVFHLLLIPAFILSFLIEIPVIYLFIKKKTEDAWRLSAILSLLTNLVSYALIFIFMILTS